MTTDVRGRHVVVAVDGSAAGIHGVRYGANEAHRLGLVLDLIHAVPTYLPIGPFPLIPDDTGERFGRQVLRYARETAHDLHPELGVRTTLIRGGRVDSIVNFARDAELIVLGTHPLTIAERLWTGATVPGVAARAQCPVIAVPADYNPDRRLNRVVVCVKSPEHSYGLLESAYAVANGLGSELVIMHAWALPTGYDDLLASEADRDQWRLDQEIVIEKVLSEAGLPTQYPGLAVQVRMVNGPAAPALIDASKEADRLLITRPVHGGYFHHLGSTARAVLRESRCPVQVFPPVRNVSEEVFRDYESPAEPSTENSPATSPAPTKE